MHAAFKLRDVSIFISVWPGWEICEVIAEIAFLHVKLPF